MKVYQGIFRGGICLPDLIHQGYMPNGSLRICLFYYVWLPFKLWLSIKVSAFWLVKISTVGPIALERAERCDLKSRFWLFFSPFLFPPKKEGRRKGEWIAKIVILSHTFLLDPHCVIRSYKLEYMYMTVSLYEIV